MSRSLFPYAKRAIDLLQREYGEGKSIMILGSYLGVGKDADGEDVAVFYTVREAFSFDYTEKALRVFVGEIKDEDMPVPPIVIVEAKENQWKKQQAVLVKAIKNALASKGIEGDQAMIEAMFAASEFGQIREGSFYGHTHIEDVSEIADVALNEYDLMELRVTKENPEFWDGHIGIEVLKTSKVERTER